MAARDRAPELWLGGRGVSFREGERYHVRLPRGAGVRGEMRVVKSGDRIR